METTEPRTRGGWKLSAPSEPKGALRRTPRVLGLLYELFDNEWMHSGHLKALDAARRPIGCCCAWRSTNWSHGSRLEWGWKAPPVGGQPPQLYELAPLGAYDLAAAGMISAEQLREWERERAKREAARADNPNTKHPLLRHQIANADVTVWFHQACAAHGYGLSAATRSRTGSNPRVLVAAGSRASADHRQHLSHRSARTACRHMDRNRSRHGAVRAPRQARSEEHRAHAQRLSRLHALGSRAHTIRGHDWYQLTVTTGGASRVEGIADRARAVGCAADFRDRFLVTNFDALALASPFSAPWVDAAGSIVPLAL